MWDRFDPPATDQPLRQTLHGTRAMGSFSRLRSCAEKGHLREPRGEADQQSIPIPSDRTDHRCSPRVASLALRRYEPPGPVHRDARRRRDTQWRFGSRRRFRRGRRRIDGSDLPFSRGGVPAWPFGSRPSRLPLRSRFAVGEAPSGNGACRGALPIPSDGSLPLHGSASAGFGSSLLAGVASRARPAVSARFRSSNCFSVAVGSRQVPEGNPYIMSTASFIAS